MAERRKLFGTNGVRGVVNEFLTPDFVLKMGKAIGTEMHGRIAVATDTRTSNIMLKYSLISGILSTGSDVADVGVIPTPALQYRVKTGKFTGGAMITASHNPPQFNGVKAIAPDGTEADKEEENRIEDAYYNENFRIAEWNGIGTVMQYNDAASDYVRAITERVNAELIRERKLTVVLDCSNGASVYTAPYLMEALGVRAVTLNGQPQGSFPGHESEPTPENLQDLAKTVKSLGADMGIAHDGDADRAIFIDEKGRYLPGELSLALIAREVIREKRGSIAVVPVSTPSVVEEAIREYGGTTVYTRVGSPVVARKMMEIGGVIGGEENGGIINPELQYCRDGGMTAAKILEIVAASGSLSALIDTLPKFHIVKLKVEIKDRPASEIIERVKRQAKAKRIDETDGLKMFFDEGWVLVRASGTEPLVRIFAEAKKMETATKLAEEYRNLVTQIAKKPG